jgi:hypothetical protein
MKYLRTAQFDPPVPSNCDANSPHLVFSYRDILAVIGEKPASLVHLKGSNAGLTQLVKKPNGVVVLDVHLDQYRPC